LLPFGGFFIVVFVGYFLAGKTTREELSSGGKYKTRYFPLFIFLVRFVAPLAIAFLFALGVYTRILTLFPGIG
jgi:NSS family neurotransmitter:Na+ symporter